MKEKLASFKPPRRGEISLEFWALRERQDHPALQLYLTADMETVLTLQISDVVRILSQ